jgi:predicted RNase H-like HicB family nuclease
VPAPSPSLFGRFGTGAHLEKEVQKAQKFESAIEGATDALKEMHGASAKNSAEQKKKHAEVAAAIQHVSKALQGTTKNADKYGKAVQKDTKLVLDFAKKHKLSLTEATAMYDKVNQRQGLLNQGLKKGIGFLSRWGTAAATVGAAVKEYRKRVDEVRTGHQLLLSDVAVTGPEAKKAFGDTQKYIDGYRKAIRNAHEMTARWGVSAEEARTTTKALAFSLRGQIKDVNKLGEALKQDTDLVYGFAKVMNVDASTALTYFRNQMRVQGKTHEEARKSMDIVIAGYDQMRVKIGGAAAPLKEEYLATLQQIRQEMGPTQVSTAAMTAAMNFLGEAGKRAGLSAKGVGDAMAMLPKIGQNLNQYHKMQLGGMIMRNKKSLAALPEGLRKQVMAIRDDPKMMIWEKKKVIAELTAGSKVGIKSMFKMIRKAGVVEQHQMMKGLTNQQKVAFVMMKKMMKEGKTFDEAMKTIEKGAKGAKKTRETLPQTLKKNTTGLDNVAIKAQELEATTKKLIDQYSQFVTPALGALTLAMQAGNLVSGLRGLTGGVGGAAGALGNLKGAAGKAGAAGALIAAGTAGWAFGKWLDKKFGISDKISNWAFEQDKALLSKMERLKRSGGHTTQTIKAADQYMKRFEQLRRSGVTTLKKQVSSKGLKPGEKGYTASLITKEFKLTAESFRKMTYKRLGLEKEVKAGRMTKAQAELIRKTVEARAAKFEGIKSTKKTADQKKESLPSSHDLKQRRAEARAKAGERALKATVPKGRATAGPAATAAAQPKTPAGGAAAGGAGETTPQSQYDPSMGTYTAQMTINANDPNWQNFFKQNQSVMDKDKRGR